MFRVAAALALAVLAPAIGTAVFWGWAAHEFLTHPVLWLGPAAGVLLATGWAWLLRPRRIDLAVDPQVPPPAGENPA